MRISTNVNPEVQEEPTSPALRILEKPISEMTDAEIDAALALIAQNRMAPPAAKARKPKTVREQIQNPSTRGKSISNESD